MILRRSHGEGRGEWVERGGVARRKRPCTDRTETWLAGEEKELPTKPVTTSSHVGDIDGEEPDRLAVRPETWNGEITSMLLYCYSSSLLAQYTLAKIELSQKNWISYWKIRHEHIAENTGSPQTATFSRAKARASPR